MRLSDLVRSSLTWGQTDTRSSIKCHQKVSKKSRETSSLAERFSQAQIDWLFVLPEVETKSKHLFNSLPLPNEIVLGGSSEDPCCCGWTLDCSRFCILFDCSGCLKQRTQRIRPFLTGDDKQHQSVAASWLLSVACLADCLTDKHNPKSSWQRASLLRTVDGAARNDFETAFQDLRDCEPAVGIFITTSTERHNRGRMESRSRLRRRIVSQDGWVKGDGKGRYNPWGSRHGWRQKSLFDIFEIESCLVKINNFTFLICSSFFLTKCLRSNF